MIPFFYPLKTYLLFNYRFFLKSLFIHMEAQRPMVGSLVVYDNLIFTSFS